jgi:hypothetical protein
MTAKITKSLLAMTLAVSSLARFAHAQDQEEGPVELNASGEAQASTSSSTTGGNNGWGDVYQRPETPESATSESAAPSTGVGALRMYGGMRLDVGGGFTLWQDRDLLYRAAPTPAVQVGADYVLGSYMAVGLETRLNWARAKDADSRIMLWDLVLKPRLRYVTSFHGVELYGALPFGLSVANFPDSKQAETTGKMSGTLGFMAGLNYFFTDHFGLNTEMGWMWHWVKGDYEALRQTSTGGVARIGEKTVRLGQFTVLTLNLVYAF